MGKRDKLSTEWLSDMERRTFVVGAAAFATTLAGCEKERETSESDNAPAAPTEEVDQSTPTEEEAAVSKSRIKLDRSTPGGSKVYATDDLSADGLLRVFHALGWEPTGKDELIERIESLDGSFALDYAEELGLGSQTYELVLV